MLASEYSMQFSEYKKLTPREIQRLFKAMTERQTGKKEVKVTLTKDQEEKISSMPKIVNFKDRRHERS